MCYNISVKIFYAQGVKVNFQDKISRDKAINMNPVVLAFIGDAVYSLFVREKTAFENDFKSGKLNEITANIVQAKAQAKLIDSVLPFLTEEEVDIFRRGRNAKKPSHSKSAKISEYNKSTGFEAVLGFLYVTGNYERLNFILNYEGESSSDNADLAQIKVNENES